MIVIFVLVLFTAVESQYFSLPGFRPDITFNEDNERFDINPLIKLQNKYFNSLNSARRHHRDHRDHAPRNEKIRREWITLNGNTAEAKNTADEIMKYVKNNVNKEIDNIAALLSHTRRRSRGAGDRTAHNGKYGYLEENMDDFVTRKSLNNIFINLGGRRAGNVLRSDVRRDAIFNYAFPIQMVVRGYLLTPPLDK